jgi:uncharacterized membrane protein
MYSDSELDAAVAAGALSPEAAAGLRAFVAQQRMAPGADEEHFRLLTSFNDVFVSIAAVLMLSALYWLVTALVPLVAGLAVSATAWGAAEYFTRQRRMALPSIVLFFAFVGGIVGTGIVLTIGAEEVESLKGRHALVGSIAIALPSAIAAYAHWRRFKVPITVAAGVGVGVGWAIGLCLAIANVDPRPCLIPIMLVCGLGVFALAMWWDMSDRARVTRRADVAFWLHLLAAPLIIHPVFEAAGLISSKQTTVAQAGYAVAVYFALTFVALVIDRRAVLVSALAYVVYALATLFQAVGAVSESFALTGVVIGSALLLLAAFWQRARKLAVEPLPTALRALLPAT